MFKLSQFIILTLMVCGLTSCGNDVAFEHPTPEDLRDARKAMGLPAVSDHLIHGESSTVQSPPIDVKSESLIPNLSLDLLAQREAYIQEHMSKTMQQRNNYYQQLGIPPSEIVQLTRLTRAYYGNEWDLKNIPASTAPAAVKAIKEDARKLKVTRTETMQKIFKPYQETQRFQRGTQRYSQNTNQQKYTGPEIPISDIIPAEQSKKVRDGIEKEHRKALQKQMDEAGITLSQSEVDEFLRLKMALNEARQITQQAYKLRSEGKNITRKTITKLNSEQSSISYDISKVTSRLQEAILIKGEPERRAKRIEAMKRQYERQNKFPSGYDLEQLYDIQKTLGDHAREQSKAIQEHRKLGKGSTVEFRNLIKSHKEKRAELNRQQSEIKARIR